MKEDDSDSTSEKNKNINNIYESQNSENNYNFENKKRNSSSINYNKRQQIPRKKSYKEDNDDENNNNYINNNENNENPYSYYVNEKEITIGKLYSYRRPYSKSRRKLIFILIFLVNILINCDHGAIPAGTKELKEAKNISNMQLGTIGSLVYL